MSPCDGADNDCDGAHDEELCDGIDNDNDGLIDEDCCGYPQPARISTIKSGECFDVTTKTMCFGSKDTLTCNSGEVMKVVQAHFGRMGYANEKLCGGNPYSANGNDEDCGFMDMYSTVAPRCNDQQSCTIQVDSLLVGMCGGMSRCKLCSKYLEVSYLCTAQRDQTCSEMSTISYVAINPGQITSSSFSNTAVTSGKCFSYSESYTCQGQGGTGSCAGLKAPDDNDRCNPKWAVMASDNTHAWCPDKCDQTNSFIQVDLGNIYGVKGIIVQGCRKYNQWVSKFILSYSSDGKAFNVFKNSAGNEIIYNGNYDSHTTRRCSADFSARYVRLYVRDFQVHPCLHIEVLRCSKVLA